MFEVEEDTYKGRNLRQVFRGSDGEKRVHGRVGDKAGKVAGARLRALYTRLWRHRFYSRR